jgi:DNA-binding PadR family transcriptional regulator
VTEDCALTDNEGTLLALVLRVQPVTAYQISKIYEASPVSNFNTSKGKLYPLVRRLRDRGLIEAEAVTEDARRTERLSCTPRGREAVREWTKQVRPVHLLLEDPMRTKVQSFDLLSRDEQIAWMLEVKSQLLQKLADVEAYGKHVTVPYQEFVHDNAIASLRCRMDWLDRMLLRIAKD